MRVVKCGDAAESFVYMFIYRGTLIAYLLYSAAGLSYQCGHDIVCFAFAFSFGISVFFILYQCDSCRSPLIPQYGDFQRPESSHMLRIIEAADKNNILEALSKNQAARNEKINREHYCQSTMKPHIFAGKIRDARGGRDPTMTPKCRTSTDASLYRALAVPPPSLGSKI